MVPLLHLRLVLGVAWKLEAQALGASDVFIKVVVEVIGSPKRATLHVVLTNPFSRFLLSAKLVQILWIVLIGRMFTKRYLPDVD
jgi:hypothetical protein